MVNTPPKKSPMVQNPYSLPRFAHQFPSPKASCAPLMSPRSWSGHTPRHAGRLATVAGAVTGAGRCGTPGRLKGHIRLVQNGQVWSVRVNHRIGLASILVNTAITDVITNMVCGFETVFIFPSI